jgi:hypothetical protein
MERVCVAVAIPARWIVVAVADVADAVADADADADGTIRVERNATARVQHALAILVHDIIMLLLLLPVTVWYTATVRVLPQCQPMLSFVFLSSFRMLDRCGGDEKRKRG